MDRSGSLDDALDTALDAVVEGRPAPAGPPELAPLVEAAAALCAAPAARVPTKPPFGTVIPEPPARRRGGWRRRVVAGLLAAALLLAPTLLASAGALPGDLLYPVKLGVETARVGVDRASPADLARLRIGIAGTRVHELKLLFD